MKSSIQNSVLIAAALLMTIQALGQESNGITVKEYIYKHTNGKPQEIEVYFPAGHNPERSSLPCLLLFHGGGWGNGDLETFRYDCNYFANRGIVAATANYYMHSKEERMKLPDGVSRKSACVTDAKSAIRWVKQHADKLGIDPEKVIVGGGSAGGHISILATTSPANDDPGDPLQYSTDVAGYVLFNPALSENDAEYPEIYAPNHLTADFPPAVVFFGTEDKWKTGWDAAMDKLRGLGAGDRIQVWLAEGEEHAFFNKQPWKDRSIRKADEFLAQLGFLKGKPTLSLPDEGTAYVKETP